MADTSLGNLWYSLDIEDKTGAKLESIIKNIKKQLDGSDQKIKIGGVEVTQHAASEFVNSLESKIGTVKLKDVKLGVDRKVIQDELLAAPFKVDLKLNVKQMDVQDAIQQAFKQFGYNWNGLSAAQARSVRSNQQQQQADDKHAESLLRQQKLQQQLNKSTQDHLDIQRRLGATLSTSQNAATMLGNAMGQAFSVYAVKNFLTEVIQIGGELEKQRLAMRSIIGDAAQADDIYRKLKDLSMISPFDVQDLVTYTKQLSAFGIQYTDLYETSKRLSDIAAGVGVSFSRIAYEYGQTSARGWLDGRELRMFANSGIPLLEKLSNYYSKLRNEIISTSQVREMVSKREVSFDDVQKVLWEMTDKGGEFYQMQEVMAESLAAKWRNLANAWNLMLGDIAEGSTGNALKGLAEVLTKMTENWTQIGLLIGSVSVMMMANKAAVMSQTAALGQNVVATQARTLAAKEQDAEELRRIALTRDLTIAEQQRLANSTKLTLGDYKRLVANKELTASEAARAIAFGRVSKEMSAMTVRMQVAQMKQMGFTKNQMRFVLSMGKASAAAKALSMSIVGVGNAFRTAGKFMMANWPTAALVAITELIAHFQIAKQEAEDFKQAMTLKGKEGYKNIGEVLEKFKGFDASTASAQELNTAMGELKDTIKEYDPSWANTFDSIFGKDGAKTAAEQYEQLEQRLSDIKAVYQWMENHGEVANDLVQATDGWFDESVVTNADDWHKALQGVNSEINKMKTEDLEKTYTQLYKTLADSSKSFTGRFREEWEIVNEQIKETNSTAEKFQLLMNSSLVGELSGKQGRNLEFTRLLGRDLYDAYTNMMRQKVTFEGDTTKLANDLDNTVGKYFNKTTENGKYTAAVRAMLDAILDKTKLTQGEREIVEGDVSRILNIEVRMTGFEAGKNLTQLQQDALSALGLTGTSDENGVTKYEDKTGEEAVKALRSRIKRQIEGAANSAELQKALKSLWDEGMDTIDRLADKSDQTKTKSANATNQKELDDANALVKLVEQTAKGAGINLEKSKKTTGSKTTKDAFLDQRQKEIAAIKEEYTEYKKLLDMYKSEDVVASKLGTNTQEILNRLAEQRALLVSKNDKGDSYTGKYGKQILAIDKEVFDINNDTLKKKTADAARVMKEQLDDELAKWNLYEKLFDASKDKEWAKNVVEGGMPKYWSEASNALYEAFKTATGKAIADGLAGEKTQDALASLLGDKDGLFAMSDEDARNLFGNLDGFYDKWKEIQKKIEGEGVELTLDIAKAKANIRTATDEYEQSLAEFEDKWQKILSMEDADPSAVDAWFKMWQERLTKLKVNADKENGGWTHDLFAGADTKSSSTMMKSYTNVIKALKYIRTGKGKLPADMDAEQLKKVASSYETLSEYISAAADNAEGFWNSFGSSGIGGTIGGIGKAITMFKLAREATESAKKASNESDKQGLKDYASLLSKNGTKSIASGIGAAASYAGELLGNIQSVAEEIGDADLASDMKSLSDSMQVISGAAQGGLSGGWWGAVVGMATSFISIMVNRWAEAEKKAYQLKVALQNYQLEIEKIKASVNKDDYDSIFGTDSIGLAQEALDKYLTNLAAVKEKVDKYSKLDLTKKLESGLDLGSVASISNNPLAMLVFGGDEKNLEEVGPFYGALANAVKDLFDPETGAFNVDAAKAALESLGDVITLEQKEWLQSAINVSEAWMEAKETLDDIIEKWTGDWSNDMADAIFDSILNGADAWSEFEKIGSEAILNIGKSMLSSTIFNAYFKKYQDQMEKAFASDDPSVSLANIISDIFNGLPAVLDTATESAEKWVEMSKQMGFDLSSLSGSSDSVTSGIKSVTEETANLLASYMNAIRADVSVTRTLLEGLDLSEVGSLSATAASQLAQLNMIAQHTEAIMQSNEMIRDDINDMRSNFSAVINGTKKVYIQ